jgi:hypothetical protein
MGGVDDGTRTHDNRDHNPGLYQLSYVHRCRIYPPPPALRNWRARQDYSAHPEPRPCGAAASPRSNLLPANLSNLRPLRCLKRSRAGAGVPGRTRTCDHRLRRPVLYPTELRAHGVHRPLARCPTSLPGIMPCRQAARHDARNPRLPDPPHGGAHHTEPALEASIWVYP